MTTTQIARRRAKLLLPENEITSFDFSLLPEEEAKNTERFIQEQHARSTRRAYLSDIKIFQAWCDERNLIDRPAKPEFVAAFLAHQAESGSKSSTIKRRAAAIRYYHTTANFDSPTTSELVRATLAGIRKTLGVAPEQKAPATVERIQKMVGHCPPTLAGIRDKALLLLCFSGALRRSELVSLQVEDLQEISEGIKMTIRKSKTDQEGAGHVIAIYRGSQLKVVEAVKDWLTHAQIHKGPLFRRVRKNGKVGTAALSTQGMVDLIKKYALQAGFAYEDYAGHSLRAGFLTSAAESGANIFKMMEVSRHKSMEPLRGYVRKGDLFKNHAGAKFL